MHSIPMALKGKAMTLKTEMKQGVIAALKAKDDLKKNILRVALGEIETEESRHGEIKDEKVLSIVRKIVASNDETIAAGATNADQLRRENEILGEYLPKTLSRDEIKEFLASSAEQIQNAPSDGAATGIAMKALKAEKKDVLGAEVKEVVAEMRN